LFRLNGNSLLPYRSETTETNCLEINRKNEQNEKNEKTEKTEKTGKKGKNRI
jgi:hypothetical protein